ncbi:MAG TPA: hypothetical protein VMS11_00755 [Solirubrobacterales bacterium]|nr:hypothetical protein [Solirubrobacterales bacterium]
MSEVVAVTIMAGASVLVATISARSTRSTSAASSIVGLARVEAETERIREASRKEERDKRRHEYQQYINAFNRMYSVLAVEIDRGQAYEICGEYLNLLQDVVLFGAPDVSATALKVNEIYEKIWPILDRLEEEFPEKSFAKLWRQATEPIEVELKEAAEGLIPPIRDDVSRDY